jgi:L-ascorbate metabolism protein UlaG (beta-lactamase superfamily)
LDLTWLGHACFRLKGRDATVMTDPFDRTLGIQLGRQAAEVVTISRPDPHHAAAEAIGGEARVVRGPGEYEIGGVMIAGVATRGPRLPDGTNARNTAYAITIDDLMVCHLGSLGKTLTQDQIESLKDPDVLLIPVGGHGMLAPAEAAEVISQLEPKLVVPMQYALPGLSIVLDPLEPFSREMALEDVRPQPRLNLTKSSLPSETTVVVLEPPASRR